MLSGVLSRHKSGNAHSNKSSKNQGLRDYKARGMKELCFLESSPEKAGSAVRHSGPLGLRRFAYELN